MENYTITLTIGELLALDRLISRTRLSDVPVADCKGAHGGLRRIKQRIASILGEDEQWDRSQ